MLDEPVSSLDPVARLEFMRDLMASVTGTGLTVIIASHVVSELERLCDWLIVLTGGQVRVAGQADDLLAAHRLLTIPRDPPTPNCPGSPSTAPTTASTRPCWSASTRPGRRRSSAPDGRPTPRASNSSSWPTCSAARGPRPDTTPP